MDTYSSSGCKARQSVHSCVRIERPTRATQTLPRGVHSPEPGSNVRKRKYKTEAVTNTVMAVMKPCRYPLANFGSSAEGNVGSSAADILAPNLFSSAHEWLHISAKH